MRSRPRRPLICYLKYLKQNLVFMWGLHKFHFLFEIKYFMWGLGFYSRVKNTCHDDIIFTKRVRRVVKLVWYRAGCRLGDPWGIHESVRLDPVCCLWSVYSKPGRLCIRCGVFDSVPTIFLLEFGTVPTGFGVFLTFLKKKNLFTYFYRQWAKFYDWFQFPRHLGNNKMLSYKTTFKN